MQNDYKEIHNNYKETQKGQKETQNNYTHQTTNNAAALFCGSFSMGVCSYAGGVGVFYMSVSIVS